MLRKRKSNVPAWSQRINAVRHRLTHSQGELARKLNTSAMAVSRWERGTQEPPADLYIQLGNLAGDPECWYFWERAGLHSADIMRVLPAMRFRSSKQQISQNLRIIHAGATRLTEEKQLAAIPVLPIRAGDPSMDGDEIANFDESAAETVIAAPSDWCPNPAYTSCLRVKGDSMAPTIRDGYIVAVDASQVEHSKLYGKVVVARHKNEGLIVSRLQCFDGMELLLPDSREFPPITLTAEHKWRVMGKVLWWVGLAD